MSETFRHWQKDHYNFMTPELVTFKKISDKYILELSTSQTPFEGLYQYAVTVVEITPYSYRVARHLGKNKSFSGETRKIARSRAIKYFNKLMKDPQLLQIKAEA